VRWEALFGDLAAQAEAEERAELEAEVRDRTRREGGLVRTVDRLRAARGGTVGVTVLGAGHLAGRLLDAGPDWLLLEEGAGRDVLLPMAAVLAVEGLGPRADVAAGALAARLDLRWALRGLARDRARLQVVLRDGTPLTGTLDRVGADHVELAEHDAGEWRRASAVRGLRLLPLSGLALLRSMP
jgi:hypothetical protein